jgi:CheY-like chemotaxis protein
MSVADVLLVEDNDGDVRLIERAIETRDLPARVHPVDTGEAALQWIRREEGFEDAPRPDLVLLDLTLAARTGMEVLDTVKTDARFRRLPVLVLTSSRSESELADAYDHHANACLRKPVDPDEFGDLVEGLTDFWIRTAELPPPYDVQLP